MQSEAPAWCPYNHAPCIPQKITQEKHLPPPPKKKGEKHTHTHTQNFQSWITGWWVWKIFFLMFTPETWRKWSVLISSFQMGWFNHQQEYVWNHPSVGFYCLIYFVCMKWRIKKTSNYLIFKTKRMKTRTVLVETCWSTENMPNGSEKVPIKQPLRVFYTPPIGGCWYMSLTVCGTIFSASIQSSLPSLRNPMAGWETAKTCEDGREDVPFSGRKRLEGWVRCHKQSHCCRQWIPLVIWFLDNLNVNGSCFMVARLSENLGLWTNVLASKTQQIMNKPPQLPQCQPVCPKKNRREVAPHGAGMSGRKCFTFCTVHRSPEGYLRPGFSFEKKHPAAHGIGRTDKDLRYHHKLSNRQKERKCKHIQLEQKSENDPWYSCVSVYLQKKDFCSWTSDVGLVNYSWYNN